MQIEYLITKFLSPVAGPARISSAWQCSAPACARSGRGKGGGEVERRKNLREAFPTSSSSSQFNKQFRSNSLMQGDIDVAAAAVTMDPRAPEVRGARALRLRVLPEARRRPSPFLSAVARSSMLPPATGRDWLGVSAPTN